MVNHPKPVGVTLLGAVLLGFAAVLVLISIGLALGNSFIFDIPQPTWLLLAGAAFEVVIAYLALRVELSILANPARNRRQAEVAMWLGVPVVWLALAGINLLLTEGQDDVLVWPLIAVTGVFWSAVVVGAAFYMRSKAVRSYFATLEPCSTGGGAHYWSRQLVVDDPRSQPWNGNGACCELRVLVVVASAVELLSNRSR